MEKPKLIVFDMDGVIVDVSRSYRDTVRRTARLFFNGILSEEDLPDPLFSLTDLARVKQAGGLNNDWELTYHVLSLLLTKVEMPADGPVQSVSPDNPWIVRMSEGDVGTGNIIKQIFQEIYLGGKLFRKTYGIPPDCHPGGGLIDRETLLIPISIFTSMAEDHLLSLATGRPRAEAEHALARFSLEPYFDMIYTLDECLEEEKNIFEKTGKRTSLSKPHPFMLDAIARNFSEKVDEWYYVGDMPDDMMAASRSAYPYRGLGILHSTPDKDALQAGLVKAGAADIINNADGILNYFTSS
ncbi:MAG: HAD hydrolase-like protein [Deltaproteobacteria bacterium]|nr:HAD hydrolase-like protein [Deltaproteobacteria bacterium]